MEIEYHWHNVYVIKRPGVDNFLKKMGEIYEIVVFTASLSKVGISDVAPSVSPDLFVVRGSCIRQAGCPQGCRTSAFQGKLL